MSGGSLNPFKPGSIYEQIGQGVGHAVENVGKNPLPIIMAVALTVVTAGAGVGLAAAELAGAEGLIMAGGVATGVEAGSAAAMISAGVNVGIANAAATAINGGNISDIATSGLIGGLTAGAAAGLSGSDLLKAVTENMDPKTAQMITSATGRSVGGALTAVLQGKDPMTGAVSGAVTGALSSALSNGQIAELNKSVASVLGNVAGAASGAATAGKDVATAIANSAVYGTLRSGLSNAYNSFNTAMAELKSVQEKFPELKSQVEELTPVAQQQQAEAQATRDRLMELSQQYETAKANNDADGMTAAANAFNALKPTFDSQLAAFDATNSKLTDLGGQLDNVQTVAKNFEDANTKLQAAFGDFTTGSTKLSEEQKLVDKQIAMLPEADKQRYSELVSSGLDGKAAIDQVTKEYADRKATADAAVAELPSQAKIEYRNALLSGKDPELAVQEAKDSMLGKILNALIPSAQAGELPGTKGTVTVEGVSGTTNPNVSSSSQLSLVSEVEDPKTGNITQTLSDGTTRTLSPEGDILSTSNDTNVSNDFSNEVINTMLNPYYKKTAVVGAGQDGSGTSPTSVAGTGSSGTATSGSGTGTGTGVGTGVGIGTGIGAAGQLLGGSSFATPNTTTNYSIPDIQHLTPGVVKGSAFEFADTPTFENAPVIPVAQQNIPDYTQQILNAADGGSIKGYATGSSATSNDIVDLTPTILKGTKFSALHQPTFTSTGNVPVVTPTAMPDYTQQIMNAATGGLVQGLAEGSMPEAPSPTLRPSIIRGNPFQAIGRKVGLQLPGFQQRFAPGGEVSMRVEGDDGSVQEHRPQFFSEGGLNTLKNTFVKGAGDGTSDSIPAMLANGEFVIPADVVSSLGNGSNDAGAHVLDEFLKTIRKHKRAADAKKLPPDSKGALGYLLEAKRKVKK